MSESLIEQLGGTAEVARMTEVAQPSVTRWKKSGIPAERCPRIELAKRGQTTVEQLRPDVRWIRVPDPNWPNALGRPCIDVIGPSASPPPQG